jgi:hypothetical protein
LQRSDPRRLSKLWCAVLVLLAGCSLFTRNTFEVEAKGRPDAVAVLKLCGKETPLKRRGDLLAVAVPITCEGVGEIRVRLGSGAAMTCQVGYVTPDMPQDFRFRLGDRQCEPVLP